MSDLTVLIFAKFPQPGAVNTRMVPPLTFEQAAVLHQVSLAAVCETVAGLKGVSASLVATPDERTPEFRAIVGNGIADFWPQGGGDLGERLVRAVDRVFADDARGLLFLGADSPTLPPSILEKAVASLSKHDAVLGPCDDGGYYLIGVRRPLPILFERVDWGSSRVAEQTRERAAAAGIDLIELPSWYDLDRFEDVIRAQRDLTDMTGATGSAAIALRTLIEELVRVATTDEPRVSTRAGLPTQSSHQRKSGHRAG